MRHKKFLDSVQLEKKHSSIQGWGIFSRIIIPKGKIFYIVPMNDLCTNPTPNCARIASNLFISDKKILNWVNHSCEPNSQLVISPNKVVLKSKRRISINEEITVDYYLTEEKNTLIPCSCGSKNCRQFFFIS